MDEWREVGMCSHVNITPDFEHVIFAILISRMPVLHQRSSDHECIDDVEFELFGIVIGWMDWIAMHPAVFQWCDPQMQILGLIPRIVCLALDVMV